LQVNMSEPASKRAKVDDLPAFPIDISAFNKVSVDPFTTEALSAEQRAAIAANIELSRNAIVCFTACGSASGYGGHTGGAFDTVPEVCMLDAFFRACPDKFLPTFFDEAGHRVATQYLRCALDGDLDIRSLRDYRKGHGGLPGHPELGMTPGIKFSSGRLGHLWGTVNGIAMANPGKIISCLGSDGSQMEGNDAEAARLAVAQGLPVKLFLDDNDVTITGHPTEYLKGYNLEKTLEGHGLFVRVVDGEDIDALYVAMRETIMAEGPTAVVIKRKMSPGVEGIEGTSQGHDVFPLKKAIDYLSGKGLTGAVAFLEGVKKTADPQSGYKGCGPRKSNRGAVGDAIVKCLDTMSADERKAKVMVIDSDLGGSTTMTKVQKKYPEIYVQSGVMERGNFAAAAGFGMGEGKQGIFSTFAAFLEMCCSEITMARLNRSNVLCHFSHSGVDDMADNTCHYGLNNMFADNGLDDGYPTNLYFPADADQCEACVQSCFFEPGLRFVFSVRSKPCTILAADGEPMYGEGYKFEHGKDCLVRDGTAGFVVAVGDCVYRALDAVEKLKEEGIDVGLINKSTLNVVDEEMMAKIGASPLVLVVEPLNRKTGLGSRFGTWLLERGLCPKYQYIGIAKEGCGGLWEHAYHHGYDSESVMKKVKEMM